MGRKRRRPPAPRPHLPWDEVFPTLDLHGETGADARRRAEGWLRARREEGAGVVRVITGRGVHSVGPPVLRGEILDLLSSLRGSVVEAFSSESGGGAFRVELRRPERPRRGAPGAVRGPMPREEADAALRREAMEALAELGVEPTPALLRLEMQRLLRERRERTE